VSACQLSGLWLASRRPQRKVDAAWEEKFEQEKGSKARTRPHDSVPVRVLVVLTAVGLYHLGKLRLGKGGRSTPAQEFGDRPGRYIGRGTHRRARPSATSCSASVTPSARRPGGLEGIRTRRPAEAVGRPDPEHTRATAVRRPSLVQHMLECVVVWETVVSHEGHHAPVEFLVLGLHLQR
jgi:hypothetical protein